MGKIDLTDLMSKDPEVKYARSKNILALAKEDPAQLYPDLDFFVRLLDSDNKILRWTSISVIGAMGRVDEAKAVDKLMPRLVAMLNTGNMITANNAIAALADIALARPEYRPKITDELLRVERYDYDTVECRNIAIGKAILAIGTYFNALEDKKASLEFVKRQVNNTRNATKKKAEQFLKKYSRKN